MRDVPRAGWQRQYHHGQGVEGCRSRLCGRAKGIGCRFDSPTSPMAKAAGKCPPIKGKITDDQIKGLVAYIRSPGEEAVSFTAALSLRNRIAYGPRLAGRTRFSCVLPLRDGERTLVNEKENGAAQPPRRRFVELFLGHWYRRIPRFVSLSRLSLLDSASIHRTRQRYRARGQSRRSQAQHGQDFPLRQSPGSAHHVSRTGNTPRSPLCAPTSAARFNIAPISRTFGVLVTTACTT